MWRYRYLAVPRIDLTDSKGSHILNHALVHFINRRLMLCRTASITEFKLSCGRLPEASVVNLWVETLVHRNVQVLNIKHGRQHPRYSSPQICRLSEHFAWESLVVLKLHGAQIAFKLSDSVMFPNLKELGLKYTELLSESKTYLFSDKCFPLLEDMGLEEVVFQRNRDDKPSLQISLTKLRELEFGTSGHNLELSQVDVNTPHLQILALQRVGGAGSEMQINTCNLESIEAVYLNQKKPGGPKFTKLFSNVSNVKNLYLSGSSAEGLVECVPMPHFPNMIHLSISAAAEKSLWKVLQHSPILETLDIQGCCTFGRCCPHPEIVPPCFGRTLVRISISSFGQSGAEIEAVRFILQHGVVLQKLTVRTSGGCGLLTAIMLLKIKRRSSDCEVDLLSF